MKKYGLYNMVYCSIYSGVGPGECRQTDKVVGQVGGGEGTAGGEIPGPPQGERGEGERGYEAARGGGATAVQDEGGGRRDQTEGEPLQAAGECTEKGEGDGMSLTNARVCTVIPSNMQ